MSDRIFDTGTDDIRSEVLEGVMTITLNRPERRNAMSSAMLKGLVASLADAETASDVGAVLLTGAGGAFCAGGDVKGMAEAGGEGGIARSNTTLESTYNGEINETLQASCTNYPNQLSRFSQDPLRVPACR